MVVTVTIMSMLVIMIMTIVMEKLSAASKVELASDQEEIVVICLNRDEKYAGGSIPEAVSGHSESRALPRREQESDSSLT